MEALVVTRTHVLAFTQTHRHTNTYTSTIYIHSKCESFWSHSNSYCNWWLISTITFTICEGMNGKASTNKSTFQLWHQAGRTKIRSYTKGPAYWWLFSDILWLWRRDLYQNRLAYYVKMPLWKSLDFLGPPSFVDLWKYFLCICPLALLPARSSRAPHRDLVPPTDFCPGCFKHTRLIHNLHTHTQLKAGLKD